MIGHVFLSTGGSFGGSLEDAGEEQTGEKGPFAGPQDGQTWTKKKTKELEQPEQSGHETSLNGQARNRNISIMFMLRDL